MNSVHTSCGEELSYTRGCPHWPHGVGITCCSTGWRLTNVWWKSNSHQGQPPVVRSIAGASWRDSTNARYVANRDIKLDSNFEFNSCWNIQASRSCRVSLNYICMIHKIVQIEKVINKFCTSNIINWSYIVKINIFDKIII